MVDGRGETFEEGPIPESPRFYSRKGNHEKAKKVLMQLNGKVEGYDVELEYAVLLKEVEDGAALGDKAKSVSILDLFRKGNLVGQTSSSSLFPRLLTPDTLLLPSPAPHLDLVRSSRMAATDWNPRRLRVSQFLTTPIATKSRADIVV